MHPAPLTEGRLSTTESTPAIASPVAESPVIRGGLTLAAGVLTGNVIGFGRVWLTAYLLGTHSRADSLAVAMGPVDTLNSVLINSLVFAFVPMLTAVRDGERTALFLKLARCFWWVSAVVTAAVLIAAPWLMNLLAPGLDPRYHGAAVTNLRIFSLSTVAAGTGAVHCAMLFTDRRFAPTAFYQAALNLFTIIGALSLWKFLGVHAFAVGYTLGAWAQLGIVYFAANSGLKKTALPVCDMHWRRLLGKPVFFVIYASGLGLNMIFTRAWATHAGPGMAAAFDYCMRGVGVPLAILVNPISNSLLPEIARLRSLQRLRDALKLIDRTVALSALAAVGGCGFALIFREPAIHIIFQHGKFTAESTRMVSAVFLGLGPSLIGWSLIEIASRSLFALDRPWLPVIAASIPVLLNTALTLHWYSSSPELLGAPASVGLIIGFAVLFVLMHVNRRRWLVQN